MAAQQDPYGTLGVNKDATDAELRSAFRRLVQLHHPDHNGGSPESARRFEEIESAYAQIRTQRENEPPKAPPPPSSDPTVESRLAELEHELQQARAAREQARRAAQAAAAATRKRPTDEELGIFKTDDSVGKILADARVEFSDQLKRARERPAGQRLGELIDELAAKLTGEPPRDPRS